MSKFYLTCLCMAAVMLSGCANKTTDKSKPDSKRGSDAKSVSTAQTGDAEKKSAEKTSTDPKPVDAPALTEEEQMIAQEMAKLSPEDRAIAQKQKICPLGKKPLGSMPGLSKVKLDDGRVIFICCEGCERPLRKNPDKWLANLEWYDGMPEKKDE